MPIAEEVRPILPSVPGLRDPSAAATAERLCFAEDRAGPLPYLSGRAESPDPATLQGNIENYIGMTRVPTGLIGPLRINGLNAYGDFYVPLATTEGALVASYSRGARLVTLSGGAACVTTVEQVQRAPGFKFETMGEAVEFAAWAVGEFEQMREVASRKTRHGRLLEMRVQLQANLVYLILDFHTGDAAGQNMVTICTAAVCEDLMARTPVDPKLLGHRVEHGRRQEGDGAQLFRDTRPSHDCRGGRAACLGRRTASNDPRAHRRTTGA